VHRGGLGALQGGLRRPEGGGVHAWSIGAEWLNPDQRRALKLQEAGMRSHSAAWAGRRRRPARRLSGERKLRAMPQKVGGKTKTLLTSVFRSIN